MESNLFTYYSLSECTTQKKVFQKLDLLVENGKIEYNDHDLDVIKITDIDLDESELEDLVSFLDDNNVMGDLSIEDNDDDDFFNDNFTDDDYDF